MPADQQRSSPMKLTGCFVPPQMSTHSPQRFNVSPRTRTWAHGCPRTPEPGQTPSHLIASLRTSPTSTDAQPGTAEAWARQVTQANQIVAGGAPLRVVYLDHSAMMSGGELALVRLLPALGGVKPHVILAEEGPLAERLRTAAISVEVLRMASVARALRRDRIRAGRLPLGSVVVAAAYVIQLTWRLRRLRPDLVHTNSLKAAIYGGLAARLAGVPVVWHVHDRIAEEYLPSVAVGLVRGLARWVPAGIIGNSRSTLDTLGPLPCPAAVVPSPIDPALLDRARAPRGDRPFTVTIVGRLAPWKGQHVFLEAFAKAFPGGPERALVVGGALFGETDYERELLSLIHISEPTRRT